MTWTREYANQMGPIIAAWGAGKTLQIRRVYGSSDAQWEDLKDSEPCFENDRFQWRVKPESILRPWTLNEVRFGVIVARKVNGNTIPEEAFWSYTICGKRRANPDMKGSQVTVLIGGEWTTVKDLLYSCYLCDEDGRYIGPCGTPE